jgi:hypothetical protein
VVPGVIHVVVEAVDRNETLYIATRCRHEAKNGDLRICEARGICGCSMIGDETAPRS